MELLAARPRRAAARNSFSSRRASVRSRPSARLPVGRDADEVAAAVAGVAAPLDQALLLELVEQADELAAVVAERVGDRALRLARALVERRRGSAWWYGWSPACSYASIALLLRGDAEPLEQERASRRRAPPGSGDAAARSVSPDRDVTGNKCSASSVDVLYIVEMLNDYGGQLVTAVTTNTNGAGARSLSSSPPSSWSSSTSRS